MAILAYQKLKDANALPSPTGVALEILRLASDEHATLDAIAAVVQTDPALSARMLKLVNSSFTGVTRKVASISAAVRLLGLRTVKNLALGVSLVSNHHKGRCEGFDYERFWSESLARAVAARLLASQLKGIPTDEAFATGLLGRIGCLALATACPKEYAHVLNTAPGSTSSELAEIEREVFRIDHNEVSAELMADWGVQDCFCEAVQHQDSPEGDYSEAGTLARLIRLAGTLASVLVEGHMPVETFTAMMEEAGTLGITGEVFHRLFDSMGDEWREAGTIFSVLTRKTPSLGELQAQARVGSDSADIGGTRPEINTAGTNGASDALHILVVDDDPASLRLLEKYLTWAGYRVTKATSGAEALEIDRAKAAQMVITDWMMPEINGIEMCRRLRANEDSGFIYIIILTAQSEKARVIEALEAGADDFLSKPYSREELLAHVRAGERIVRLEANLAERGREISRCNAELTAANERLRILATTDELTGLLNRREGLARLAEHWALAARHGEPISCIMADIDHFKHFNDTYGHDAGDAVLRATAGTLQRASRTGELVCRLGGEEFLIICPRSGAASAQLAADRMRLAVVSCPVRSNGHEWSATVSLGVAERTESMARPDDLLKAADEMLYTAKQMGRNRVCVAETLVDAVRS